MARVPDANPMALDGVRLVLECLDAATANREIVGALSGLAHLGLRQLLDDGRHRWPRAQPLPRSYPDRPRTALAQLHAPAAC